MRKNVRLLTLILFTGLAFQGRDAIAERPGSEAGECAPVLLIKKEKPDPTAKSSGTSSTLKAAAVGKVNFAILYPEGGETFKLGQSLPVFYKVSGDYVGSRTRFYLIDQANNWREIYWHHYRSSFPPGVLIETLKTRQRLTDEVPNSKQVQDPRTYLDGTPISPGRYRLGVKVYVDGPPHYNINYAEGNTVAAEVSSREFKISGAGPDQTIKTTDLARLCEKNQLEMSLNLNTEAKLTDALARNGLTWFNLVKKIQQ